MTQETSQSKPDDYKLLENMILDNKMKKMSDFQLQNLMSANVHTIFVDAIDAFDYWDELLCEEDSIIDSFNDFVDMYNFKSSACDLSETITLISQEILNLMSWYRVHTALKTDSDVVTDFVFTELTKAMSTGLTFDDCEVLWCREYGFSPNSQVIKVYRECILNMNMDIRVQDIETYYYCALACLVIMASNVDKLINGIKSGFTIKSTFWSDILLYDKEHV